jgi:alpha-1,2-mannosyltransferase
MLAAVGSGSFVTRGRMRGYCMLLLVAYVIAIGALLATADGLVDRAGRPLGTDFANVYAAGKLAHEGRAALAYDFPAHHDMQRQISGRADIPYYGWHYPPAFLLLAAALSVLPISARCSSIRRRRS